MPWREYLKIEFDSSHATLLVGGTACLALLGTWHLLFLDRKLWRGALIAIIVIGVLAVIPELVFWMVVLVTGIDLGGAVVVVGIFTLILMVPAVSCSAMTLLVTYLHQRARPGWIATLTLVGLAIGAVTVRVSLYEPPYSHKEVLASEHQRLTAGIEEEPGNIDARIERARIRSQLRDRRGALEDIEEALRIEPENIAALSVRAELHQRRHDLDGARSDYGELIRLEPDQPAWYRQRADVLLEAGDIDRSRQDLATARALGGEVDGQERLRSRLAERFHDRAHSRRRQGDLGGEIRDLEAALEVAPPEWKTVRQRPARWDVEAELDHARRQARLVEDLVEPEAALERYASALRSDPDDVTTLSHQALLRERLGDLVGAREDYTRLIGLEPRNPVWYECRSVVQLEEGRGDRAITDMERACRLKKVSSSQRLRLADLLLDRALARKAAGDLDGASEDLEAARRVTASHRWLRSGEAYQALEEIEEAR